MEMNQSEQLSRVIDELRKRGAETFEEMIMYQANMILKANQIIKSKNEEIEIHSQHIKSLHATIDKLDNELKNMEEKLATAEEKAAIGRRAATEWMVEVGKAKKELERVSASGADYGQHPVQNYTFNSAVYIGHAESNYNKGDDSHAGDNENHCF